MVTYSVYALFLGLVISVCVEAVQGKDSGLLTREEIEENVQQCAFVQSLSEAKAKNNPAQASLTTQLFAALFPSSSPAINALLATAYISGPPNFLLALCPPNIDPSSLSIMVAFAVGGLLGDTLFHLLPEIFLGEDEHDKVKFVMVEPNRNLLLGVGIIVGLVTFMVMDKALRIATGGDGGAHSHSHSHSHAHEEKHETATNGSATATSSKKGKAADGDMRQRKAQKDTKSLSPSSASTPPAPPNPSVKLAGLLNLIADFTHNITDGLALSSSFYASPALGATTTMAVFFHEIPHEVGDFALLIQSGFSKRKAMGAQFVTAVGAFLGTLIGIFVQEYGGGGGSKSAAEDALAGGGGIWGTSLSWGDMLLPFTAGTFLYVGTVAVIPELLETGPNKWDELRKTALQFGAMFVGAAIMLGISWS
ncbi:major histocompatibility complex, class I [Cladophialophora psammophila CBS 110553]|uniref:Major histocompatibility complex, class I n=1 Tax=Cladophialophora psammophila CBS 110553 TaxID=1182543 RepID=W9WXN0_9EURO|nr:major histocompatibility complex, class I [Cladophialophora psammophila CBS 110553]EXJ72723.1 major histocompatibility complex, class I [Cladophialophora psammophila CBS 110553]